MSNNTRHIVHRGRAQGPHPHANTVHYTQTGHTHPSPKLFTHRTCYSKQSARSRLANVESAAQLHMHARRGEPLEASSASVQPRPCRLRSPVSTAGRGHQGHPCGEGWHAPLETAGIYLLR